MSQVLICTQEPEETVADAVEQDEVGYLLIFVLHILCYFVPYVAIYILYQEIGQVLHPESARSSITIHSWTKFKKVRQSQAIRTPRQPKRPALQVRKPFLRPLSAEIEQSPLAGTKQVTREGNKFLTICIFAC